MTTMIDVQAALTRLRQQLGDTVTVELLAAAAPVARSWPGPTSLQTRYVRTIQISAEIQARAPEACARARAARDAYIRAQISGGRRNDLQGPLADVFTVCSVGAELDDLLGQAIADLAWLRDALAAPADKT
jgi:hypothetical protein